MPSSDSDKTSFLRDLSLLLGLPIVGIIVLIYWWSPWPDKFDVATPDQIFDQVSGTWHWVAHDTCGTSYHTIGFDSARSIMTLVSFNPATDSTEATTDTTIYDLQGHGTHHIRGFIRGETRKSLTGDPVVWDLVLTSPNSYQWKQAGISRILGYSGVIERCPVAEDRTGAPHPSQARVSAIPH